MNQNKEFTNPELHSLDDTEMGVSGSSDLRFVQNCLDYFVEWMGAHIKRLETNHVPSSQTLIMLYEESPKIANEFQSKLGVVGSRTYKVGYGIENGLVVSNENLQVTIKLIPKFADFDEAMSFVLQNFNENHTFVMILLAQRRMLVHQNGEDLESWCQDPSTINLSDAATFITPEIIRKQLDIFHDQATRTPLGVVARNIWHSDNTGVPKLRDYPERQVQSGLLLSLWGFFGRKSVFIDEEIPNPGGRLDIRLAYVAPKKATTILELKILDTVRSAQNNLNWAISGVHQAHAYRRDDTEAKIACIFDARRDKSDAMPSLYAEAQKYDVDVALFDMEIPPVKAKKVKAATKKKTQVKTVPAKKKPLTKAAK